MKSETFRKLFPLLESNELAAGPMIAADHLAYLLEKPLIEVNSNADLIAEGLLKAHKLYDPDLLIVFADIAVEAEAMGVELDYPNDSNPHPRTHLKLDEVEPVDMSDSGRIPELFRAAEIVKSEVPTGFPIFISMKDPFSLAALVRGADDFLASLLEEPESARKILEICCENQIGLVNSICKQGFFPLIGAPMGSGSLIGPDWFASFAKPYIARLFNTVLSCDSLRCIHICGEVGSLVDSLIDLQPDVLSFEEWDAGMWDKIPDTIPMGNVSTFLFTSDNPKSVEQTTHECLNNLATPRIISTACDLPPKANPVLVKRMMDIARLDAPSLDSGHRGNDRTITTQPDGTAIKTRVGANIKRELERNGQVFLNNCGNRGECLSCAAIFEENPPEMTNREQLAFGMDSRFRMTCQHTLKENITIFLPHSGENEISKPLSDFCIDGGGSGWGIGVDLGSTVVALYLANLKTGEIVGQHSFLNPQIKFGGDVMSRLEAAKDRKSLLELTGHIHSGIAKAINYLCHLNEIDQTEINKIFIAGNSVMSHFWLGHAGEGIERVPFRSFLEGQGSIKFDPGFISLSEVTDCRICPIIEGFIGGDTVAAIIASGIDRKKGNRLLIDLGTNGEIVLANDGVLSCTSTAAGPAFEGVGMASGMPAVTGAVKGYDPEGNPDVIGDIEAVGICGSGYIEVIARLLEDGNMSPTGLLEKDEAGRRSLYLSEKVQITQDDIRKFQLAKGAVAAGIEMLIRHAGIDPASIDEIILTGSFGSRVDPLSAIKVGLIPDIQLNKVSFIDNAAGRGSVLCLGNKLYQDRAEIIQKRAKVINLGETDGFEELFVKNMHFPGSELNDV